MFNSVKLPMDSGIDDIFELTLFLDIDLYNYLKIKKILLIILYFIIYANLIKCYIFVMCPKPHEIPSRSQQ